MLPIVDTHVHLLDFSRFRYSWTATPERDYLRSGYTLDDWRADIDDLKVLAAVHVEAGVDRDIDPAAESQWLAGLDGWPTTAVFVGYANPAAPDFDEIIRRHSVFAAFKGIREPLPSNDDFNNPQWLAGLQRLAELDLSFDLFTDAQNLGLAAQSFGSVPGMRLVVEHTGMPPLNDSEGMSIWRSGLLSIAHQVPNSFLKISGFSLFADSWDPHSLRSIVREAIDIFGPERCMFASNYPVDSLATSYKNLWLTLDDITSDLSLEERTALFSGTALRAYRIDLD